MSTQEQPAAGLVNRIREALLALDHPHHQRPLLAADQIVEIEVREGDVAVVLELPARLPVEERTEVEDRVRATVEGLAGVTGCLVDVVTPPGEEPAAPPAHHADHHHGHSHGHAAGHDHGAGTRTPPPQPATLPGVKRVIAVASGKGGVGKSTVALNLALALSARGLRVGLLDADMHGPSFPTLLGIDSIQVQAQDGKLQPIRVHDLSVMSLGFLLDRNQPVVWRGPMISGAIKQLLQDVSWGDLDVLVVDLPPGTGDAQLTLVQTAQVDQAVIVTTPSDLALSDARRGLLMFHAVHVPVLGIVENMSYFVCPHCDERSDVFGAGGGRRTAETLGVPFLGEIPLDLRVGQGNDRGRPFFLMAPDSPPAKAMAELAQQVARGLGLAEPTPAEPPDPTGPESKKGFLAGLFGKN